MTRCVKSRLNGVVVRFRPVPAAYVKCPLFFSCPIMWSITYSKLLSSSENYVLLSLAGAVLLVKLSVYSSEVFKAVLSGVEFNAFSIENTVLSFLEVQARLTIGDDGHASVIKSSRSGDIIPTAFPSILCCQEYNLASLLNSIRASVEISALTHDIDGIIRTTNITFVSCEVFLLVFGVGDDVGSVDDIHIPFQLSNAFV